MMREMTLRLMSERMRDVIWMKEAMKEEMREWMRERNGIFEVKDKNRV
jgi:hypothetical protein